MVLIGDIVGHDETAVMGAVSDVVRMTNTRGAEGFIAVSPEQRKKVLARPLAHRRHLAPHQRLQDQRGRGDPAAADGRLLRRHRAHQHRAVHPEQAGPVRRPGEFLQGELPLDTGDATIPTRRVHRRPPQDALDYVASGAPPLAVAARQPRHAAGRGRAAVRRIRRAAGELSNRAASPRLFHRLQDYRSAPLEDRAQLPRLDKIFDGQLFGPMRDEHQGHLHKQVLRGRVFVALHMHAGDGNVHTNIPVNSDNYEMLQTANRAVDRIMALARSLDGVISGEHGIGITKLDYLTDAEMANFWAYKQKVDRKAASTAAS